MIFYGLKVLTEAFSTSVIPTTELPSVIEHLNTINNYSASVLKYEKSHSPVHTGCLCHMLMSVILSDIPNLKKILQI